MGFFSKIGEGLKKTRDSLLQSMNTMLHSFTRIDEELFEEPRGDPYHGGCGGRHSWPDL